MGTSGPVTGLLFPLPLPYISRSGGLFENALYIHHRFYIYIYTNYTYIDYVFLGTQQTKAAEFFPR